MEANYVRTREDLTRVVKKIRRALREMRELERISGKG
jgi:DNA-binding winged helix-turn-helix (wHTH) protein